MLTDAEIAELVQRLGVEPQRTRGVLLVDDEQLNLRVLRSFLAEHWTVHEASSGAEGLELAARVPLDVVVADQRMPGMTGVEMLTELRQRRPDIAGIVLTGFADMRAMESAINRASVFRFLRKPCEPSDMIEAVEQAAALVMQRRTIERLVRLLADRSEALRASLEEVKAQREMLLHLERLGTIGKLAAGVTHDLRNLMVAFRGLEAELAGVAVPRALGEILRIGLAGVETMLQTLGTIHEFVRTGTLDLDLKPMDPAVLATNAMTIARMDVAFKLHVVTCEVPARLPAIRGDRQKLTQVLVNLVRNAIHATTPEQRVRVTAEARGGEVVFAVEDDGPGVSADVRERLFQPFVSTKGDAGVGLGLYMARLIVGSHRGRIELVDRPRGARFEVALPIAADPDPDGGAR